VAYDLSSTPTKCGKAFMSAKKTGTVEILHCQISTRVHHLCLHSLVSAQARHNSISSMSLASDHYVHPECPHLPGCQNRLSGMPTALIWEAHCPQSVPRPCICASQSMPHCIAGLRCPQHLASSIRRTTIHSSVHANTHSTEHHRRL
jgi:hypothetical protein